MSPHFSLPKTSSEMAAVLRFQDAVPCKIRAKRGCATHPRSIAERVSRSLSLYIYVCVYLYISSLLSPYDYNAIVSGEEDENKRADEEASGARSKHG